MRTSLLMVVVASIIGSTLGHILPNYYDQRIPKCQHEGTLYDVGTHFLDGCLQFNCRQNGADLLGCGGGVSLPGGECDQGVPLYPTARFPDCCHREFTCTIVA